MIEVKCNRKRQRGISIVIVLFLLVVVSGLVISVTQLTGTQHINTLFAFRSAQSYFAARAGLDYLISRVVSSGGCVVDLAIVAEGYNVALTCTPAGSFNEGNPAAQYNVYALRAVASGGGFSLPDAANREVRATIKVP